MSTNTAFLHWLKHVHLLLYGARIFSPPKTTVCPVKKKKKATWEKNEKRKKACESESFQHSPRFIQTINRGQQREAARVSVCLVAVDTRLSLSLALFAKPLKEQLVSRPTGGGGGDVTCAPWGCSDWRGGIGPPRFNSPHGSADTAGWSSREGAMHLPSMFHRLPVFTPVAGWGIPRWCSEGKSFQLSRSCFVFFFLSFFFKTHKYKILFPENVKLVETFFFSFRFSLFG